MTTIKSAPNTPFKSLGNAFDKFLSFCCSTGGTLSFHPTHAPEKTPLELFCYFAGVSYPPSAQCVITHKSLKSALLAKADHYRRCVDNRPQREGCESFDITDLMHIAGDQYGKGFGIYDYGNDGVPLGYKRFLLRIKGKEKTLLFQSIPIIPGDKPGFIAADEYTDLLLEAMGADVNGNVTLSMLEHYLESFDGPFKIKSQQA
jgi:hypothetical protein